MSISLARRTSTVCALLAGILVAGAVPVLAAAPADPRPAEVTSGGGGREAAPGQQEQDATAPVVGPPTGISTGPDKAAPAASSGPAEPAPAAKPAPAPAAAKPAAAKPAAEEPATTGAPPAKGPGRGEPAAHATTAAPAGGPVAAPRSVRPAAGPVVPVIGPVAVRVAAPVSAPVMGPHVPWTSRPTALASAGSRSDRARAAAAAPLPVRPNGAEPIVLPAVHPQPTPVGLGAALPTVAVQTVGAVARTPEWPLGIAVVVLLFLLMQNRIDRRDPKLGQARLEDEAPLEFAPLAV